MDKATLLATIQSERADLDALLAKLSPEQMCQTMTDSQWSIKDVLAHLAAWERRCVTWIEAGLHGETPERPAPGFKWEDLDRLNEQTFLENRDLPLDDVQAISRQAYEQLVTTVQALSEEDLNDPQRFPWTEGETLVWYIAANSYDHYLEHQEHIHSWLVDETMQA